jgi:hypothetical protein
MFEEFHPPNCLPAINPIENPGLFSGGGLGYRNLQRTLKSALKMEIRTACKEE